MDDEPSDTGKLVTLRSHWRGAPPEVGHYCRAAKGRTAYRIVAITPRPAMDYNFVFKCARTSPATLPADAVVHLWVWDKRIKKRRLAGDYSRSF